MKKHISLALLQLIIGYSVLKAQIATVPNFPDVLLGQSGFLTLHNNDVEPTHSMFITGLTPAGCNGSTITALNWPKGTWRRGYQDYYTTAGQWCNSATTAGGYYSNHPLIRHTSENGRAYMHLARQFGAADYIQRTKWAAKYLSDVQPADGGFIWWYHRHSIYSSNTDEDPTVTPSNLNNYSNAYEQGHALVTMADNYWYLRSINDPGADAIYDDIEHAATKFLATMNNNVFNGGGSLNYKGFAMWGMATAYKVTANRKYLQQAIQIYNSYLRLTQETNNTSVNFGTWPGTSYALVQDNGSPVIPTITVEKEAMIWYHFIILRGLVETLTAIHEMSPLNSAYSSNISSVKTDLYNAIERGINHVILNRFDATTNKMFIYPRSSNSYWRTSPSTTYTMPPNVTELTTTDAGITTLGMLAYHALTDNHYSSAEKTSLINLLNRAIAGENSAPVSHWYFTNYATYNDYIMTIRNKLQFPNTPAPTNQLKRVIKAEENLLFVSSGVNKYDANPYVSNVQTISSPSLGIVDKWIKGDFNGDGTDEIYFKNQNSTNIYASTDINFPGSATSLYYSGPNVLSNWVKGDFNGDGKDELVYQLVPPNTLTGNIYKYSPELGTLIVAANAPIVDKWIVGDFDGNGSEELLFKYAGGTTIYKNTNSVSSLVSNTSIYTGTLTLDKWIVGDFNVNGGDGKDELIYKFAATTIYKHAVLNNLAPGALNTTTVYAGNVQIDKWIVGDFDGDLDQEILQSFTGIYKIYYSEDGAGLGAGQVFPATGTHTLLLKDWIVGDFDGDRDDDLMYWFDPNSQSVEMANPIVLPPNSTTVRIVDDVKTFLNPIQYSTISPSMWLVGNFNPTPMATSRLVLDTKNIDPTSSESNFKVFPNPFIDELNISINLEEADKVSIDIYDLDGRLLSTVIDDYFEKGSHTFMYHSTLAVTNSQSKILLVKVRSNQINTVKKIIMTE